MHPAITGVKMAKEDLERYHTLQIVLRLKRLVAE